MFEQRTNEVALMPVGAKTVEQTQQAPEEEDLIKLIAAQGQEQLVGPLRLGMITTVRPYILPDPVPLLHKRAPAMLLEIEEHLTANLATMLKHGKLDALHPGPPFEEPGIATLPLYEEVFNLVVSVNHAWVKKQSLDSRTLGQEK